MFPSSPTCLAATARTAVRSVSTSARTSPAPTRRPPDTRRPLRGRSPQATGTTLINGPVADRDRQYRWRDPAQALNPVAKQPDRCSYGLSRVRTAHFGALVFLGLGWFAASCWVADKTGRGRSWPRASSYEVTPPAGQVGARGAAGESISGQRYAAAD